MNATAEQKFECPPELRRENAAIFAGEYNVPLRKPPETVLDIGANLGAFTVWARAAWPECKVWAYEPIAENADVFQRNCGNGPVTLVRSAVRDYDGEADIFLGDMCAVHGFHQLGRQTKETRKVSVVNAARLPSAEFVKVDTEGCEPEIIKALDLSQTKAVAFEWHRAEDEKELRAYLLAKGFYVSHRGEYEPGRGLLKMTRELATRSCYLGMPVYGAIDAHGANCLFKLTNNPPCVLKQRLNVGDSLVSRSRNTITADFLESDCSDLMMVDSDLVYSPAHIARMMDHAEPVVGGLYPKKQQGQVQWVLNTIGPQEPNAAGLVKVKYVGSGFLRVKREALEAIVKKFGEELWYTPDHPASRAREYDFWTVGVYKYPDGSRRYLSEDWFFCQRCLDAGLDVWADCKTILKHVGQAIYPLQSQEGEIYGPPKATEPCTSPKPS